MVEAYHVQTDEWGFPWYDEWTPYRSEGPERLSVALTDERTWFHGAAPSAGHSAISIRVSRVSTAPFATLADALLSTFHHELFHNLQRNIHLHSGGNGRVSGAQDAWGFFAEGTAILAASVGQPRGQFTPSTLTHTYMTYANAYLAQNGGRALSLNQSYERLAPHKAALYWRYLYEGCATEQNSNAGMQVVRRALLALYSGEIVDVDASTDLVEALPALMDRALAGSSCPFQTYRQSLAAFARALYGLRLEGGRCLAPGTPAGCGFYDPQGQYRDPPLRTLTYTGARQEIRDGIMSSFGIDLIEVVLDPAPDGQPLAIEFHPDLASRAKFDVQLWLLEPREEGSLPRRLPVEVSPADAGRRLRSAIPPGRTLPGIRVGLIITRLDTREDADPIGKYTIVLRPPVSGSAG
jgi:hypothetical protein